MVLKNHHQDAYRTKKSLGKKLDIGCIIKRPQEHEPQKRVRNQIKDNPANLYRMSSDKGLCDHFNIIFDFFMPSS